MMRTVLRYAAVCHMIRSMCFPQTRCALCHPRGSFLRKTRSGKSLRRLRKSIFRASGSSAFRRSFRIPTFCSCGYYGYGNLGDESSLECLISAVRREIPDARLTVLASSPAEFSERFGVRAVDRMSFFSVMREIRRAGVFVFGGGGLLQDATSRRSLRYYTHVLSAASKRCRTFVYANGIGPLERRGSRQSVMRALGGVEDISVRDGLSASFLSELGLEKDRFRLGADGAFMMMPPDEASVASVGERIGFAAERDILRSRSVRSAAAGEISTAVFPARCAMSR